MGSIMSAIYDDMEEEAYKEKTHKRTKKIIEIVTKNTKYRYSQSFRI